MEGNLQIDIKNMRTQYKSLESRLTPLGKDHGEIAHAVKATEEAARQQDIQAARAPQQAEMTLKKFRADKANLARDRVPLYVSKC